MFSAQPLPTAGLSLLLCAAVSSLVGSQGSDPNRQFIAFRYDAERVVIYTAQDNERPSPIPDLPHTVPPGARWLQPPLAKYPGRHIIQIQSAKALTDRPGEKWTIAAAPGLTVTATAERPVFGGGGCFGSYGILARVDEPGREAFRNVALRYHIARRGAGEVTVAASPLGKTGIELDEQNRARIEAVVRPEIERALRSMLQQSRLDYAHAGADQYSQQWASAWKRIDGALLRGESTLRFDVQRFTLTPDAAPRLYVRTALDVGGQTGFLMSFWLRDTGDRLVFERSDADRSRHIRIREYGGPMATPLTQLGEVLAVTDVDHDGWAEMLLTSHGYEAMTITAFEYTDAGLQRTGPWFEWGC